MGRIGEGKRVMIRAFRSSLPAALLLAAVITVSGCAAFDVNHRPEAPVVFEQTPSADASSEVLVRDIEQAARV